MKKSAIVALVVGVALIAWLLASNDLGRIAALLAGAGWGIALVVALHLPQTFLSGVGWGALLDPRPGPRMLFQLRWVREAVNALLPVAQIGGEVVRARLVAQAGVPLVVAVASIIVDVSVEMVAQAAFTLVGVALLLGGRHAGDVLPLALGAVGGVTLVSLAFLAAQRFGLFRLIERLIGRGIASGRFGAAGDIDGLDDTALALYREPRRLWRSGAVHFASWCAGVIETWAALHVLGIDAPLREAFVIESLGQAVRAVGFMVPGALGVQEGGYVVICALFGIAPQQALALSLVRRIRELALGIPGLLWWRRLEARRSAEHAEAT